MQDYSLSNAFPLNAKLLSRYSSDQKLKLKTKLKATMFLLTQKHSCFHLPMVLLILSIPLLGNAAYKWVDKNGIIHYSQIPPPHQEAEEITLPAPPDTSQAAPEALETRLKALQLKQADQEKAAAAEAGKQKHLAARKHNCEVARKNLEVYQGNPRWLIGDKQGIYTRLSEAERNERIAETKQQLEANCDHSPR